MSKTSSVKRVPGRDPRGDGVDDRAGEPERAAAKRAKKITRHGASCRTSMRISLTPFGIQSPAKAPPLAPALAAEQHGSLGARECSRS